MPDGTRTTGQILADLQSLGIVDPNEWLRELYGIPRASTPAVRAAGVTAAPAGTGAVVAPPGTIPQATRPTGLAPLPPARATTTPLETAISDAQTFLDVGGAGTSPPGPSGGPVSFAEGGRISGPQQAVLAALGLLSPVSPFGVFPIGENIATALGFGRGLGFGEPVGETPGAVAVPGAAPGLGVTTGVGVRGPTGQIGFGEQTGLGEASPGPEGAVGVPGAVGGIGVPGPTGQTGYGETTGLGEFGGDGGAGSGGSPGAGGAAGGAGEGGVGEGAPHRGRLIRRGGWQRLEAGEYVVNREAARRFRSLLDALNELTPRYRPARRP